MIKIKAIINILYWLGYLAANIYIYFLGLSKSTTLISEFIIKIK